MIKRLFRNQIRFYRDAVKSIFRNFSLSIAAIAAINITLIVVGLFLVISLNIHNFSRLIEEDVTIYIGVREDVTEERLLEMEEEFKNIDNITEVIFSSKDEELSILKEEISDLSEVLEQYEGDNNPLLNVFNLKVADVSNIDTTVDYIEETYETEIKDIEYGEKLIKSLLSVFDAARKVGIIIIVALLLVTAFLISNTIKITIFSRREEIRIMRLVGASNYYIRTPFVLEGLFLGVIGSIVPIAALVYGYDKLYTMYDGKIAISPFIRFVEPYPFVYQLSIILLVLGVLVGMWGSGRSVRKFLKI